MSTVNIISITLRCVVLCRAIVMKSTLHWLCQLSVLLCVLEISHGRVILSGHKDLVWTDDSHETPSAPAISKRSNIHLNETITNQTDPNATLQQNIHTTDSSRTETERKVRSNGGRPCRARLLNYGPVKFTSHELFKNAGEEPRVQVNKRRETDDYVQQQAYPDKGGQNHSDNGNATDSLTMCPHSHDAAKCEANTNKLSPIDDSHPNVNILPEVSYMVDDGNETYGQSHEAPQNITNGQENEAPSTEPPLNPAYEDYQPTQLCDHIADDSYVKPEEVACNPFDPLAISFYEVESQNGLLEEVIPTTLKVSITNMYANKQAALNELIIPYGGYLLAGEYVLKKQPENEDQLPGGPNQVTVIDRIVISNSGYVNEGKYAVDEHVREGGEEAMYPDTDESTFEEVEEEDAQHYYERMRKHALMVLESGMLTDDENHERDTKDSHGRKNTDVPDIYMLQELDDEEMYNESTDKKKRPRRTLLCDPLMRDKFCPNKVIDKMKRSSSVVMLPLDLKLVAGIAKGVTQVASKIIKLKTEAKAAAIKKDVEKAISNLKNPPTKLGLPPVAPKKLGFPPAVTKLELGPLSKPLSAPGLLVHNPHLHSHGGNNFRHHHTVININPPSLPSLKRNVLHNHATNNILGVQTEQHAPISRKINPLVQKVYNTNYYQPKESNLKPPCQLGLFKQKLQDLRDMRENNQREAASEEVEYPHKIRHQIHNANSVLFEAPVFPPRRCVKPGC